MAKKKSNDKRLKNLISLYVSDQLYEKIVDDKNSSNRHNSVNSLLNDILAKHYRLYENDMDYEKRVKKEYFNNDAYQMWYKELIEDDETMQNDHLPLFLVMIERMVENDLSDKTVMDFGCNQGLFLRVLYKIRKYKYAYGIDVKEDLINIANKRKGSLPVEYIVENDISVFEDKIDVAFSHEVIYLLPDLEKHARNMYKALKQSGSYYAVVGRHSDNPLWNEWKSRVEASSNIKVQEYSLDDVADAFEKNGFEVYAQKFMLNNFINIRRVEKQFNKIKEGLDFYWDHKTLFRFEKK